MVSTVHAFALRLRTIRFFCQLCRWGTWLLLAIGTVLLVVRQYDFHPSFSAFSLLILFLAYLLISWLLTPKPSAEAVAAFLDHHHQAGGQIMSQSNYGGPNPSLTLVPAKALPFFGMSLFVCLVQFLPLSILNPPNQNEMHASVALLDAKNELLAEFLEKEDFEQNREDIQQLAKKSPEQTGFWEQHDYLDQRLEKQAEESMKQLQYLSHHAQNLSRFQEYLSQVEADQEKQKALEAELAELWEKLRQKYPNLSAEANQSKVKNLKLVESQADLQRQIETLRKLLKQGGELDFKSIDQEALEKLLEEARCQSGALGEQLALFCNKPGRGGRHTDLDFVDPVDINASFRNLNPETQPSLDSSTLLSTGTATPNEIGETTSAFGLQSSQAGEASAHTMRILPQHLQAVERYFQRKKE